MILAGLSLRPTGAWSQSCAGSAPFSEGAFRVGVAYAKPGGNEVRTARAAVGAFNGSFVDGFYSRVNPRPELGGDRKGFEYGAEGGLDWYAWRALGLHICPDVAAHAGRRNGVSLQTPPASDELTNDRFVMLGAMIGRSPGVHGGVVIVPTAGLWLVRDRANAAASTRAVAREYGVSMLGVGLVILKRYTAGVSYERHFAIAHEVPRFLVFRASIDLGKGSTGDNRKF